jgi:hypothetical protein
MQVASTFLTSQHFLFNLLPDTVNVPGRSRRQLSTRNPRVQSDLFRSIYANPPRRSVDMLVQHQP